MRSLIGMPSHRAYLAAPAFVRPVVAMSGFMPPACAAREFIFAILQTRSPMHSGRRTGILAPRHHCREAGVMTLKGTRIGPSWAVSPFQPQPS